MNSLILEKNYASYLIDDKTLQADMVSLLEEAQVYKEFFRDRELLCQYGMHLSVLEALSHETDHANQQRILMKNRSDVCTRLLAKTYSLMDAQILDITDEEIAKMNFLERAHYDKCMRLQSKRGAVYNEYHI